MTRQCVGCGNEKMGARAKYCNKCGTELSATDYEPSIEELEDDKEWYDILGGKCSAYHHLVLLACALYFGRLETFCPDCGLKLPVSLEDSDDASQV